jgi:catechol 2,3-dioxygenase-like lactoylglutathione lyase family enzyme
MKRFHVHVSVDDLDHNIRFYSSLFGAEPSVKTDDYANKHWVQDPQGIAWETFHTLSNIPVFGRDTQSSLGRIPSRRSALPVVRPAKCIPWRWN